ncbi:MAG: tRNA (adenosine(37)-N6)-threonylcarbamoyltransferase complex dimerization subunit type 1 TsaB [Firmicutes bacterium]|nr:tRNA (adenosine(37)-N6)-threonylcarbamoyltransferase complex dimerization subunit type 1 TsaB [Bacillota bacterium]
MYLLAIETTGAYASVALLQAEESQAPEMLGVIHGNDRYSHLQNLTPQIDQILRDHQLQIGDIGVIAVSHGPGSFTGIRIGVATARGLGQILGIPCVAVSSLEALALRAPEGAAEPDAAAAAVLPRPTGRTLICPVLDARRKQVYGAAYERASGELAGSESAGDEPPGAERAGAELVCRISEASILMVDFLKELDKIADQYERILFLGDGIDTCGDLIGAWAQEHAAASTVAAGAAAPEIASGEPSAPEITCVPESIRYQDAAAVALRGWQLFREGKDCQYIELQPEYLRMAEAEKKLRDRQAAEAAQAGRKGNT